MRKSLGNLVAVILYRPFNPVGFHRVQTKLTKPYTDAHRRRITCRPFDVEAGKVHLIVRKHVAQRENIFLMVAQQASNRSRKSREVAKLVLENCQCSSHEMQNLKSDVPSLQRESVLTVILPDNAFVGVLIFMRAL